MPVQTWLSSNNFDAPPSPPTLTLSVTLLPSCVLVATSLSFASNYIKPMLGTTVELVNKRHTELSALNNDDDSN